MTTWVESLSVFLLQIGCEIEEPTMATDWRPAKSASMGKAISASLKIRFFQKINN